MPEKKNPEPDAGEFAGALINLARDAAKVAAEKIVQPEPKVQKYLRDLYETAFVDGAMYVIKNEIDDRVADSFAKMNRRDRRAAMRKIDK